MSPPAESISTDSDATALPRERVLFRNDGDRTAKLRVVRRRAGRTHTDGLDLAPAAVASLPVPPGTGAVTVEVHGARTTGMTTFHPDATPPVFCSRDGAIVVVRE